MNNNIGVWLPCIKADTGVDTFTRRLASALQQRGIRAEITWLPHKAEYLPWTVKVPTPPEWATVVHINSWLHQRFIPKHLPSVVTMHSCVHDQANAAYKSTLQSLYHRFWVRTREHQALSKAVKITAVSQYTADQTEKTLGFTNIETVYNWVDTKQYSPVVKATGSPFRLLFVGKLSTRKGADLLPQIMRALGPDFVLRFTGDNDYYPNPEMLPENMLALGRIDNEAEMVKAYQNNDALLFPTRLEGFGLAALEAQACGLPVIATDGTSLPEVVANNTTGILCTKDDVQAFVQACIVIKTNAELYQSMASSARQKAETEFTEDDIAQQYIDLYAAAIATR